MALGPTPRSTPSVSSPPPSSSTTTSPLTTDEARNQTPKTSGTVSKKAENDPPEPRTMAPATVVAGSRQVAAAQTAGLEQALARALANKTTTST